MSREQFNKLYRLVWTVYVAQLVTFFVLCFGIGSLLATH